MAAHGTYKRTTAGKALTKARKAQREAKRLAAARVDLAILQRSIVSHHQSKKA